MAQCQYICTYAYRGVGNQKITWMSLQVNFDQYSFFVTTKHSTPVDCCIHHTTIQKQFRHAASPHMLQSYTRAATNQISGQEQQIYYSKILCCALQSLSVPIGLIKPHNYLKTIALNFLSEESKCCIKVGRLGWSFH